MVCALIPRHLFCYLLSNPVYGISHVRFLLAQICIFAIIHNCFSGRLLLDNLVGKNTNGSLKGGVMKIRDRRCEVRFFGKPKSSNLEIYVQREWVRMNFGEAVATFFLNGILHNVKWKNGEEAILKHLDKISIKPNGVNYSVVIIDGFTELGDEGVIVCVERIIFETSK